MFVSTSIMGFDVSIRYDLMNPRQIQLTPNPFSLDLFSEPNSKTYEFGDDMSHGSMQIGSNIKTVASSDELAYIPQQFVLFAASSTAIEQPVLQMNADGSVHQIFVRDDGNGCMVEVTAPRSDIRVFAPDGSAYPLSFLPSESGAEQAATAYNATVCENEDGKETILLALGSNPGIWTIQSSGPFSSTVMHITPLPKVTDLTVENNNKVTFKTEHLDAAADYMYTVILNQREYPDSAVLKAYTLASDVPFTAVTGAAWL